MSYPTSFSPSGLVIHGLRNPSDITDTSAVLFATKVLKNPPASLSSATQKAWIDSISGEAPSADIRKPSSGSPGSLRARIHDVDGNLSKLFVYDPVSPVWYLQSHLDPTETSIQLLGPTVPTDGQVLWIEEEAIQISGTPTTSGNFLHDCTIVRGVCGSFAKSHRIIPSVYYLPGSDGTTERIIVTSKPSFGTERFLCTAYKFRENKGAAATILREIYCYLTESPKPVGQGIYEVSFRPIIGLFADHKFGEGRNPVEISNSIEVLEREDSITAVPQSFGPRAKRAALWLTGVEASLFFNEPTQEVGRSVPDQTIVSTLNNKVSQNFVTHYAEIEAAGFTWVYEILSIEFFEFITQATSFTRTFVRVDLEFVTATNGARIDGNETSIPQGNGPLAVSYQNGFAEAQALPLALGEPAPKITLKEISRDSTATFFLRLAISDAGNSGNEFDVWFGRRGLALPPAFFNIGTAAADETTITKEVTELKELDQFLPERYFLPLSHDGQGSDLLDDLCRLHTLLPTPLRDGPLTLKFWAKPLGTPSAIRPEMKEIEVLQDVRPLRALEFVAGLNFLTFEPETPPFSVSLQGTRASGLSERERVWIHLPKTALSVQSFQSGEVAEAVRAFLITLRGEPIVLNVPTDLTVDAVETCDQLSITDELVPSFAGRGVTNKTFVVVSLGLGFADSSQPLLLLPDELNNPNLSSNGRIAPTLQVEALHGKKDLGGSHEITLKVSSLGEPGAIDITTLHQAIWADLASTNAFVRVLRTTLHNADANLAFDRAGYLECYGKVKRVTKETLTLEFSDTWERDGFLFEDYLKPCESFVCLTDLRIENVISEVIAPDPEQLFPEDDFLKFSGLTPFDGHFSLIG